MNDPSFPFSIKPDFFTSEPQASMILSDDQLVQSIETVLVDPDAIDRLNYLQNLHMRYQININQHPEDQRELIEDLLRIDAKVIETLSKRFDLDVPSYETLSPNEVSTYAAQLYNICIVYRETIVLEFLADWLPINYRRIADFTNMRSNDILYQNLIAVNPENAQLLYRMGDVLNILINSNPSLIEPSLFFQYVFSRSYSQFNTEMIAHMYGVDTQFDAIVYPGQVSIGRYFGILLNGARASQLYSNLYSRISVK